MKILNEKGIIHRDLKPQNILLNRENNDQSRLRVKIGKYREKILTKIFFFPVG